MIITANTNRLRNTFLKVLLVTVLCVVWSTGQTSALSGSDFNPANIIDDAVFFNNSSMNAGDIQVFLNSKVPTCDTWGTQPYAGTTRAAYGASKGNPAPYTCIKDFTQNIPSKSADTYCPNSVTGGTKSAAQIIYDVAQACRVSPKVLIVLLQKEQALITDDWPWTIQYTKATGFYCPDDPNNPGWCDPAYAGFFNQVYNAARQFNRYVQQPNYFNFASGRTSFISYQANNTSCGGTNVTIQNGATAALYNYTPYQPNAAALSNLYGTGDGCSAYGNRNFWRLFNDWFGSTKQLISRECDSRIQDTKCVWSLTKTDGSQFLTTSKSEVDLATGSFDWTLEGVAFYARDSQTPGTIPVYRIRRNNLHYYTADVSEYNSKINSGIWTDEGIGFYSFPSEPINNASNTVYKLYNPVTGRYYWTKDQNKKSYLINIGYTVEINKFSSLSSFANTSLPPAGRLNIYRTQHSTKGYFYTRSLVELESVIDKGFLFEGILTTTNNTGEAIYRLRKPQGGYFFTGNTSERDLAKSIHGMIDEGVGFYLDNGGGDVYRTTNTLNGNYFYTSSFYEAAENVNKNGWIYEGKLFHKTTDFVPVYRFLNLTNNRHFYTTNTDEAMKISNKGWKYETVAFNTKNSGTKPIYRLRLNDKYFFTQNINERDLAINEYYYVYEGVAFAVNSSPSNYPIYRLQGGGEYFYTASINERDLAINEYYYVYEGVGFYLP